MRNRTLMAVALGTMAFAGIALSQPPGGREKGRTAPPRPAALHVDWKEPPAGLVLNPRFLGKSADPKIPAHYKLSGDAFWVWCGEDESTDAGIALDSANAKSGTQAGMVSQQVTGFAGGVGKWFRFSVRGLAEPGFLVERDGLFLRIDFFGNKGTNPLDGVTQNIYDRVERDRKDLAVNGKHFKNGGAIWKTYAFEFRLPFADIDALNLGVGFRNGVGKPETASDFFVTDFALTAIPAPADAPAVVKTAAGPKPNIKSLLPLGGRWYYDPEPGLTVRPATLVVTAKNAERLYYMDDRLSNPFAANMTAWLRKGNLDLRGNTVEEDRFVPDNVVLEFKDGKELVVHTRNLPNHPTAVFPRRDTNPNTIQERDQIYYLPLDPVRNPNATAMDATNSNKALPMGAIGFAINGVAFFNPFDMGNEEAVNILDRCCGHPSPGNQYHYHKYPVCVKSPFVDDGVDHSPLIGFALDGFPLYGPYVARGLMAKDDMVKPLDAFSMRHDDERGWHYHVTPGKYPYTIGGFAGTPDPRNLRRGPPRQP